MSLLTKRGVARRPDPPPLETDDVRVVAIGTALWVAGLVVLLALRAAGVGEVRDWWLAMCVCGAALGVVGIGYCRRRRGARTAPPPDAPHG